MSQWLGGPEGAESATVEARSPSVCPVCSELHSGADDAAGGLLCAYDDGNGMWISHGVSRDLSTCLDHGVRRSASDLPGRLNYHTPIYAALNSARRDRETRS